MDEFDVPSVRSDALTVSYTWRSPIPDACVSGTGSKRVPCVLGVDEAGRGPVLGPLVYGIAYCPLSEQEALREVGFADSKALTAERRDVLLQALLQEKHRMGWAVRVMAPQDISAGMLRRQPHNLNEQSFDATVLLIQGVLDSGVDVTQIFVDTVGDPKTYAAKLQRAFPRHGHIEWTVARKADATYPIVGAASIAAKVTRDACIDRWLYAEPTLPYDGAVQAGKRKREEEDEDAASTLWETGSGYPGDPKTVRYLRETLDPIFGWAGIVRFSWATAKSLLEEPYTHKDPSATSLFGTPYPTSTRAYKVHWIDEAAKEAKQSTLKGFFTRKPTARTFATAATDTSAVAEASGGSEMQQVMRHDRKALQEQRPEAWHRMALTSCSATDFL